ncbi:MAG TPA: hypothetical protein VFT96_09840 [Gemmatimonadaceae bacterium]|nr:hypothetical protein [Gemmatimonadaceae bacterium]
MTVGESVARERVSVRRRDVAAGIASGVAATCVLLAAGIALLGDSRWLSLPRGVPAGLWLLAIGVNVALAWYVWRRAAGMTPSRIAAQIEREQQLRAGTVQGALEVGEQGALGRRAAHAVAHDLAGRGPVLVPALRARVHRRATMALAAAIGSALLATVVAPMFDDGLLAVLHPVRAYSGQLLPPLSLADMPTDVLRGEPVHVRIAAPGRTAITLHHRAAGASWEHVRIPVVDGEATADLGPMRSTMHVVATDGRTVSDTAVIAVADRPFLGDITLRAVFPAYLGRAPEVMPVGPALELPRGTVLHIAGRASVALRRAALATAGDMVVLRTDGHAFAGRLVAASSARWTWLASAERGPREIDVPDPMMIGVVADSAPVAEIVTPAADTAVGPAQRLPLLVGAGDDHGLASLMLETVVERDGNQGAVRRDLLVRGAGLAWEGPATVDIGALGAAAGDVVLVRAVATDASPWVQAGASRVLRLRILTTEEQRDRARTLADSAVASAVATARAQRALGQRTEDAARTRDRTAPQRAQGAGSAASAMSHEAGERARTIAQEQRQLVERVQALREAARQLEQALAEAGAMDSSLARQLRDAQSLMRQALTPELMAQMQRLEQAAQRLDGEEARQAIADLARMQQQLREQLEQSAEMLKRAAHEGAMRTLSDEARELAERQRALADSVARGRTEGTREAQALADRSDRYADDVSTLQERLARDRATAAADGAAEARRSARQAEELLRDASQGAQRRRASGQSGQVAQGARDAASQMDRAAEAMQAARDAQVNEWKQELTKELDRAAEEMAQMAKEEQALAQQAREGRAGADQLRGRQSSVQQGVEQTRQRLQEAGKRSALVSGGTQRAVAEAREKVRSATRQLGSGASGQVPGQSAEALAEAAEALQRAVASVARDRQRAASASSASGFEEMLRQMQEMAQRQGNINSQAQGLLQMPGGQQSPQAAQLARALGRQQREVAQGLDDISEEGGGSRTGELAQEARALADALDAGRLDARTTARQEQLFKRLLDAGRSLEKEEREDSDRREARAATGAEVYTPESGAATGRAGVRFREPTWEELRGLSAEERRAIIEYFRRINAASASSAP